MADRKPLFQGSIGGNREAGKVFSLKGFTDNLIPAAVSCGVNAIGGAAARWIGQKIDHWRAGMGTLGVALLSLSIKAAVQPVSEWALGIREVAAGMAGYVGDEVFDSVWIMLRSTQWTAGKTWKAGELVAFEGQYFEATKDIPKEAGKPGEDALWTKYTQAQFGVSDLKECSKIVFQDKQRVETISSFLASQIGSSRGWTEQEIAGAKEDLAKAMGKVGEEIASL